MTEFLIIILLQVIFKCCKLIPVMIGGIIIQGELILYFLLSGFVGYYILADFLSQRCKNLFYSDNNAKSSEQDFSTCSGEIHSSQHSFPESVWHQTTLPLNVFHPKIEILGRILNGFYLFSFIGSS